jgi:adenylate cyclase
MRERGSTQGKTALTMMPERTAAARAELPPVLGRVLRDDIAPSGTLQLVKPAGDSALPMPPAARPADPPASQVALDELERLLASRDFDGTPRSRAFLRFIVEETLGGRQDGLTQTTLATRVFGRRQDFDPTIDPIVRIQAGRLRRSLERYYLLGGTGDPVRIELPRGGYVPVLKWATSGESSAARGGAASRRTEEWPAVVVGPFRTGGSDWREDETALRFCERLAFELGRYGDVRVALRSELDDVNGRPWDGASFALSGHLSTDGGAGARAIARLVDCRSGRQVWAEEFRGGLDLRALQDETARRIAAGVASEHGVVARTLWAERRGRASLEPTSYDAILRSYQFLATRESKDFASAIDALQRVVVAEPECGLAWVQLARLYAENCVFDVSPIETSIELAVGCAHTGTYLDPAGQRARSVLAQALFVKGELAAARIEALRALELDPCSFAQLDSLGWLMTLQGDDERGLALIQQATARNPNHAPIVFQALWAHHLRRGELEASHEAALQYRDRSSFWPGLMRACSLGHLGRGAEAGVEIAELLGRRPELRLRGRALVARLIRIPELFGRVLEGLAKAGLVLE